MNLMINHAVSYTSQFQAILFHKIFYLRVTRPFSLTQESSLAKQDYSRSFHTLWYVVMTCATSNDHFTLRMSY